MRREPRPIADLVGGAIDQACRRRGFASSELVMLWPELVGADVAEGCRPEKIVWPRRRGDGADGDPAILVVAADGPTALVLTHAGPQFVERINAYLGWRAIGRIRIEQTYHRPAPPPVAAPPLLTEAGAAAVARAAAGIADGGLRQAVERLGRAVLSTCHPAPPPDFPSDPASPSSDRIPAAGRGHPVHRGVPQ